MLPRGMPYCRLPHFPLLTGEKVPVPSPSRSRRRGAHRQPGCGDGAGGESGHRRGRAGLGGTSREAERVRADSSSKTVTPAEGVMETCERENEEGGGSAALARHPRGTAAPWMGPLPGLSPHRGGEPRAAGQPQRWCGSGTEQPSGKSRGSLV